MIASTAPVRWSHVVIRFLRRFAFTVEQDSVDSMSSSSNSAVASVVTGLDSYSSMVGIVGRVVCGRVNDVDEHGGQEEEEEVKEERDGWGRSKKNCGFLCPLSVCRLRDDCFEAYPTDFFFFFFFFFFF